MLVREMSAVENSIIRETDPAHATGAYRGGRATHARPPRIDT
jgi:hypothetical protein